MIEDRGVDFYQLDDLLTPEEREVRQRVRQFVTERVLPTINDYWERADSPLELLPELGRLGVLGGTIRGYGCPGLSTVATGLVALELSRGDGSVNTLFGVQSGLAMAAIYQCGSEEQRQRWLPPMARGEKLGAFALTEPWVGSDAAHLQTRARRQGDHYILRGAKRWIGNASVADVTVVWARDEDEQIGGFLVERGTPGFQTAVITGKGAMRAVWQAEITLDDCRTPIENRLVNARSFRDIAQILVPGRLGVAWGALGHAVACYESALAYARTREQFGRPIAAFQLVQDKLVRMLAEITAMQLLCWRASRLCDEGRLTPAMASLAKMNNAAKARKIAADARDLLGGNGILLEHDVIRHQTDLEAVFTYEGTDHTNALLVGREITGFSAFA
ncbi:MAG TPA: acyl-CoA dehydrogenase family protein [Chloroflexota bacterium]|jgi:glutaryl-CoA dehydrogenase|nr:acyl-CoA dehydrogenase family protein [Chloroflexota bacterium]